MNDGDLDQSPETTIRGFPLDRYGFDRVVVYHSDKPTLALYVGRRRLSVDDARSTLRRISKLPEFDIFRREGN